jgi:hypothetical protein
LNLSAKLQAASFERLPLLAARNYIIDVTLSMANTKIGAKSDIWTGFGIMRKMREIVILIVHLVVTAVRLIRPGGLCSVVAESLLI